MTYPTSRFSVRPVRPTLLAILALAWSVTQSEAQTPLFSGQLEPGATTNFTDWVNGSGTGAGFASPHPGLEPESERAVWIETGGTGHNFSQAMDSAGADYWELDFLFATKLGDGGNAVQVNFSNASGNGAPNVTVLNSGDVGVRAPSGFITVLTGVVSASVDANANNSFDDAGDTLNVHRMRIIGHDWGTTNAAYDVLVSDANVIDGTFAHHVYGLTIFQGNDPTNAANASVDEVRFQGQFSANDYVVDNVSMRFGPQRPFINGDFEHGAAATDFTGWVNGSGGGTNFAFEHAGLVSSSARAVWVDTAGSGGDYTFRQEVDSAAADVFTLDFLFATKLGAGGNAVQFTLGNQAQANNVPNITVGNNGDINLRQPVGWETIFPGAVIASVDADGNDSFADPGDTLNVYRMRVVGRNWGTPRANFDVYLSDANVTDGTFALRHFGSTTFQSGIPDVAGRDSLRRVNFQAGFSNNDYVIDNISVSYSSQGPGFTQQTRTVGELIAEWDVGGDPDDPSTGGRTTTMGVHRGHLFSDTRDITANGGAVQVWDISDITDPREVTRGRFRRPFHYFFMTGDFYYSSDQQTFWDLSDMTQLKAGITPYTVPDSLQFRDWFMAPYAYIGQNGYSASTADAQIWDMRSNTLLASGPEGLNFVNEFGFNGQPFVIGNLMLVAASNLGESVASYDVSDPANPVLLDIINNVGGRGYEPAIYGHYVVMAYPNSPDHITFIDFSDPDNLHVESTITSPPGNNRYMNFQDTSMFIGDAKYDISDIQNPCLELTYDGGDEYHLVLGNMVVVASTTGNTRIYAHQAAPDTTGPMVTYNNPEHGAVDQAVTTRVGIVIPETLDHSTINSENFIVRVVDGAAISGTLAFTDKDVITFTPDVALTTNTTYEVELVAGGISDISGNGLSAAHIFRFSTGDAVTGGGNNPPVVASVTPGAYPAPVNGSVTLTASASDPDSNPLEYRWDFGDGTPRTAWSSVDNISHTFAAAGHYAVILQVRDSFGAVTVETITVTVMDAPTGPAPTSSSPLLVDESSRRVWVVNPDNDTVTAIHADTLAKEFEVNVGGEPVSVAQANDGSIWVTCEDANRVDVLNSANGATLTTIPLGRGTRPYGIAFNPAGTTAYVALAGTGEVAELSAASRSETDRLSVGGDPRAIAVSGDGSRLWVTRLISPDANGEVWEIAASSFTLTRTIPLAIDAGPDTSVSGRGLPNYLTGITVSPDGQRAWIPAKKDNIQRGQFLDGQALTFENTVRAIAMQIDLTTNAEAVADRMDFDNTSSPFSVTFSPLGDYAFVASQGNNELEVVDTFTGVHLFRIGVGSAPQGMVIDTVNNRAFVKNFMDRTVSAIDMDDFFETGDFDLSSVVINTVATESLAADVLLGKQIFYNSIDTRMSMDSYISCAACHLDGGHDGRTWDFTDRGEGLRNTTNLRGRSGMAHGNVHWSANFDEIQDFEHDMRGGFGGTGFMSDTDFNTGTRNQTLGDPKAGVSAELDALAAYVASLGNESLEESPHLNADGSMTAAAMAGKQLFDGTVAPQAGTALSCTTCHNPASGFTDSTIGNNGGGAITLHDVGTIKAGSGQRLGATLTGIDTPTLLGLHAAAPYLHDGSAATIAEVFDQFDSGAPLGQDGSAHNLSPSGYNLTAGELNDLVAYLLQIDGGPDLTPPTAPTGLVATAGDGSVSLDWDDNTESDFATYNVYRSTTPGSYGAPLETGLTSSDYVDNTAVNGTTYYYVVTAVDSQGNESGSVGESSGTPSVPSPDIRVTEYYLTTGDFTGTTTTITLGQPLANDYYILVRGSRTGDGASNPNNDYARVISVPGGRGDLAASGANNLIGLQRQAANFDWEGVVTVVECGDSSSAAGFRLVDAVVTAMTSGSGTDTSASWADIDQVVLFGGYRGGGVEMFGSPASRYEGTGCYTRLHPSGSNTINWSRNAAGETMHDATMTTFVVEWGSEWTVQHVNVAGNNGGNGANAAGEYTTAAISSVARANTWVWGTGTRADAGIGDCAESCLITLGNGVNQNANETTVAVGSEYTDAYDFDVYVMTHPGLQVDHRFKADGDATGLDVAVTVDSAPAGARFGWVYNGVNGTGSAFARPRFWSRYTSDTTVTVSRGYDGQNFPAWVQGVDFSGLNQ